MWAYNGIFATEAAEALNYLALAGYDASEAATALPTILNLAGAGAMDLATASDMVTDAMSALQLDVTEENLNSFADQLAKTASSANTSVEQLGEGILTVGATAANLAGGTTELNTALGILADVGIKGSEGGTHLRNVILKLQQPTSAAASMMNDLGVSVYDAEGNMNSLQDIFGDLSKAMDGMSQQDIDEIMGTLFNKTDLASANALLANCTDRWDELSGAIENSAGACEEMYNIQLDNLNGDVSKLTSGLSDLGISIYQDLQGPLREVTQMATGMVSELSQAYSEGGLSGMVGALGSVMAEGVETIGSYLPQAVEMGVGLVESFVNGISENSGQIAEIASSAVTTFISGVAELLPNVLLTGVDVILNFVNAIIQNIPSIIQTGASALSSFITGLADRIPDILSTGIQLIITLITGIGDALPSLIESAGTLVSSLIDAILNTNWIQVGIDIIKALASGIVNCVKSLGSTIWKVIKGAFTGGDTGEAEAELESMGTEMSESYASGIEAGANAAAAAAESISAITASLDTSSMESAGADTVDAYSLGITTNIPVISSAADELGTALNDSFDTSFDTVQSTTETAMQAVTETTTKEAQAAADAIKDSFESMEIVIPKPKIPVITTSYRTESYGEGGSIQIPEFNVNWNALGGIFDQATILGGANGLEGVGEAGPEAVLPLDTMWEEMRSIFSEALAESSGQGIIKTLLDKLESPQEGGGTAGSSYEFAGAGGPNITYAPVYNLNGTATKEDAIEAERMSQAEFDRMMRDWERNNKRTKF